MLAACVSRATTKKGRQLFLKKKVHPDDLAGGFSDLEMTWLKNSAYDPASTIYIRCSDRQILF